MKKREKTKNECEVKKVPCGVKKVPKKKGKKKK